MLPGNAPLLGKQRHLSDIDQITKNAALFNAIRKKPNEISEEARRKKVGKCLKDGANINSQDKNDQDNTVLHISTKNNHQVIVKFLLEKGAKFNIPNNEGMSPLALAQKHGDQKLIKILTKSINVPSDGNCLFWAVALAYLTPAKDDNSIFEEKCKKLFGQDNVQDLNLLQQVQTSIKNYNPFCSQENINNDPVLNNLVTRHFRSKVIGHMRDKETDFKQSVEGESGLTFDKYLDRMNVSTEWGGEPEIKAMSQMLGCVIEVHSTSSYPPYGVGTDRIAIYHEGLISDTHVSRRNHNHYNFGVHAKIVDVLSMSQSLSTKRKVEDSGSVKKRKLDEPQCGSEVATSSIFGKRKLSSSDNNGILPIKKLITFADEASEYSSLVGSKSSLHGTIYQLKLLILFLQRGLNKEYSFRLATEMDAAEKFDDLVFQYAKKDATGTEINDSQNVVCRFLQAKHKQDENKQITYSDLSTEDTRGEFSLPKYFTSYRKIMQKAEFNKSKLRDFVICTNISFDFVTLKQNGIEAKEITESDDFLDMKNVGKAAMRYKLTLNEQHELYDKLTATSDLHMLAKALAEHIKSKKQINLTKSIFKSYHTALVQEKVIVIQEKKNEAGKMEYTGKFHENFISCNPALSETITNLRKILKTQLDKIKGLPLDKKTELKLSSTFGKGFELDTNPQLIRVEEFVHELVTLIKNAKVEEVITIKRRLEIVKVNIDRLAGHVLVEKDQRLQFRLAFLDINSNLPGNLAGFRKKFIKKLEKEKLNFNSLARYHFRIKDFVTCEEGKLDLRTKLPEDYIDNQEIRDFFDKLVFAVNQPNEVELGNIISSEIGEEFNLLDSDFVTNNLQKKVLDWMKLKEGKYLSTENVRTFFNEGKEKIAKLVLVGPTSEYCKKIRELGIIFNQTSMELQNFLMSSTKRIFNLVTAHTTKLGAVKVNQALQGMGSYKQDDSYIFIRLSSFICMQERVVQAFSSSISNKLLVIECKTVVSAAEVQALYSKLSTIVQSNTNKKIILITKQDDALANKFKTDGQYHDTYDQKDDANSFSDFTIESQKYLLEKKVIFQGQKISLNKLIDENSKELIDSEILVRLINDEEIKIGNELTISSSYDKDYYIERKFDRKIEFKAKILTAKENYDLMAINGITKATLSESLVEGERIRLFDENDPSKGNPIRFIVLDDQEAKEQFNALCNQYPARNIHWLKSESEKLIWQQSHGSISGLVEYIKIDKDYSNDKSIKKYSEDTMILQNGREHKVVIISDTAGMGKSTVLTDLAYKMKGDDRSPLWVVRNDLNNYSKVLDEELKRRQSNNSSFNIHDTNSAVDFLLNKLLESDEKSRLKTTLEKEIFKQSFGHQNRITVMFDGFDEISNYKEIVMDLLQSLRNTAVNTIWVTTRPNMKQELEEGLDVFAYTLEPFFPEMQIEFLIKFWKKKLGLNDVNQEGYRPLIEYAKALLDKFGMSISDKEKEFTGIALQIRMVAEVFQENIEGSQGEWQGCKEFLADYNENKEPKLPEKFDLLGLYEHFVKKKFYDFYLQEKQIIADFTKQSAKKIAETYFKEYKEKHELLALHRLLKDKDLAELLSEEEIQKLDNWIKDFKNGEENEGIIDKIIEDKAHFIHLTFAEYFASFPLVARIFSESTFILKCTNNIIATTSPVFIETIIKLLDKKQTEIIGLLQGKTLLNLVTEKGHLNWVKALLEVGYDNYPKPDNLNKTPLHYAAEYGHTDIINYLLDYNNDILEDDILEHGSFKKEEYAHSKLVAFVNKKDKDSNTAVYYAVKKDKMEIACNLLLKGAESDALKEYIKPITLYVAKMTHSAYANQDHKLRPLEEKLLLQAPDAVCNFTEYYEYPRLLSYFFVHGRIKVIDVLLNSINDTEKRKRLLNAADNNSTPLDRVNQSYDVSDDDRLGITKYLLENDGIEIKFHGDGDYISSILQAAAERGHIKTFKYFINQKNQNYYYHFYLATKCQQFQIIQYLFDNHKANINLNGNTPLHAAVESGSSLKTIKYLVDNGEDVNAKNYEEKTPLFMAISADRRLNIIKYLVDHGADVNVRDDKGNTPLYYAIIDERQDYIKYLLTECKGEVYLPSELIQNKIEYLQNPNTFDINLVDQNGMPRLHCAIQSNNLEWSKFLIRRGADINNKDQDDKTPLHWASQLGHTEIVELLLQHGAIFDAKDINNRTPRDLSTRCRKIAWLLDVLNTLFNSQNLMQDLDEQLLEKKSSRLKDWGPFGSGHPDVFDCDNPMLFILNARNTERKTLFHIAADTRSQQSIDILLEYNLGYLKEKTGFSKQDRCKDYQAISIDTIDFQENTPLHLAARKGFDRIVSLLLDNGAVFNAENNQGQTPETLAKINHQDKIIKLLQPTKDLFIAIEENSLAKVKNCITEGAKINVRDKNGKTPLHVAVASDQCDLDLVQFLLRNEANVRVIDNDNRTPLHFATKNDKIVKLLLKNGAIFDGKDKQDKAPFELESNQSVKLLGAINELFNDIQSNDPDEFIDDLKTVLEDYTIDISTIVNVRDNYGNTMLHYAAQSNYLVIVQFLLENGAIFNAKNKSECIARQLSFHKNIIDLLYSIEEMFNKINDSYENGEKFSIKIITNVRNDRGMILLHQAALSGESAAVKWLVEHGANINATDNTGKTPLVLATEANRNEIIAYLKSRDKLM